MRIVLYCLMAFIIVAILCGIIMKIYTTKKLRNIDGVVGVTRGDEDNGKVVGGSF